ncbi:MAG: YlxR family protein [Fimbriimonadaceae bacterium]|nr:YlxR family protein [Fimbriimonadaceae bacterium]
MEDRHPFGVTGQGRGRGQYVGRGAERDGGGDAGGREREPGASGRIGGDLTPERTCIVCRRRMPQGELIRFARGVEGTVSRGKGPGRGAYCCPTVECSVQAADERRLRRAWRSKVTQAELEGLARELKQCQR